MLEAGSVGCAFARVGSLGADGDRRRGTGKKPPERSAATGARATPADGDFALTRYAVFCTEI